MTLRPSPTPPLCSQNIFPQTPSSRAVFCMPRCRAMPIAGFRGNAGSEASSATPSPRKSTSRASSSVLKESEKHSPKLRRSNHNSRPSQSNPSFAYRQFPARRQRANGGVAGMAGGHEQAARLQVREEDSLFVTQGQTLRSSDSPNRGARTQPARLPPSVDPKNQLDLSAGESRLRY